MRKIQQSLVFACGMSLLLAAGCAWDGKEMAAQSVEVAAPVQTASEGMQIHAMFEIAKRQAVVADLPAQF